MRVTLDDQSVSVTWKYDLRGTIIGHSKGGTPIVVERTVTTCIIKPVAKKSENVASIVEGEAGCHSGDCFCKNVGRIRSLTHALRKLYPHSTSLSHNPWNKQIRTLFWEAYKDMRHGVVAGKGVYHAPLIMMKQAIPI